MRSSIIEDITYYVETFFDRLQKLTAKWRYLSWETKVKVKGVLSVLALLLAYTVYSRSWMSLSIAGKAGLILFTLAVLGVFASTLLDVLNIEHV